MARARPDLSVLSIDPESREGTVARIPRLAYGVGLLAVALGGGIATLVVREHRLPQVRTVTVRELSAASLTASLTTTGYTYARRRAAVGARVLAPVRELLVEEGDRVDRGDVLAFLDDAALSAEVLMAEMTVAEAEANLAEAKREIDRRTRLFEAGILSASQLEAQETKVEIERTRLAAAGARLDVAESRREFLRVIAPMDGVVVARDVQVGEIAGPAAATIRGQMGAIVHIADLSSIEVEADVSEAFISRLTLHQAAVVEVDGVPDRQYHGHLRQIIPTADRQRAAIGVRVAIEDLDSRLVPEMSCTVMFLNQKQLESPVSARGLAVPKKALLETDSESQVLVLDGDHARARTVVLGAAVGHEVLVSSGLTVGEQVVLPGEVPVGDGDRVRIVQ